MDIFRRLESEQAEKLDVDGEGSYPFISPHDVCRAHKMVVNRVGEMVCRYAIGFQKNNVLYVFRHFNLALYEVTDSYFFVFITVGTQTQHKRRA